MINSIDEVEYRKLVDATPYLDESYGATARLEAIDMGYTSFPSCEVCGKPVWYNRTWKRWCSTACHRKTDEYKKAIASKDYDAIGAKRQETMLKRYGYRFNSQRPEVKAIIGAAGKARKRECPIIDVHRPVMECDGILSDILDRLGFDKQNNIAIEVNGIYWHSEDKVGKNYHRDKMLQCRNAGVFLMQFWDYEIQSKPKIIESMIASKLGLIDNRIAARKCEVIEVEHQQAKEFLDANHLQGYIPATVHCGLIYNGSLVHLVSIRPSRYKKGYHEIARSASALGTTVVGGFGKILSRLPRPIISYADLRYSAGKAYERLGFVHSHDTEPSPIYSKGSHRRGRWSMTKRDVKKIASAYDESLTVRENIAKDGWLASWDCGHAVFML